MRVDLTYAIVIVIPLQALITTCKSIIQCILLGWSALICRLQVYSPLVSTVYHLDLNVVLVSMVVVSSVAVVSTIVVSMVFVSVVSVVSMVSVVSKVSMVSVVSMFSVHHLLGDNIKLLPIHCTRGGGGGEVKLIGVHSFHRPWNCLHETVVVRIQSESRCNNYGSWVQLLLYTWVHSTKICKSLIQFVHHSFHPTHQYMLPN